MRGNNEPRTSISNLVRHLCFGGRDYREPNGVWLNPRTDRRFDGRCLATLFADSGGALHVVLAADSSALPLRSMQPQGVSVR